MTTHCFNLDNVHHSWKPIIHDALLQVDANYLNQLHRSDEWLPGHNNIFNAFSLPIDHTNYVLFGESPYPRRQSANGYAFWDASINELWSETGLNKKVNRATSMRNIIKMLLVTEGLLNADNTSQPDIASVNKHTLVKTNEEFFSNLMQHGFLLLNATPVLQAGPPKKDANAWRPFMRTIINQLIKKRPDIKFILFGKVAYEINQFTSNLNIASFHAEHPYNLSFINNLDVQNFFRPLHLLKKAR